MDTTAYVHRAIEADLLRSKDEGMAEMNAYATGPTVKSYRKLDTSSKAPIAHVVPGREAGTPNAPTVIQTMTRLARPPR